ncbi:MAG: Fe(2+)-trafficking protein [Phycisphaerales bacterium]|jgi:Fe-S cluster biosynthesis and repair protein YggX
MDINQRIAQFETMVRPGADPDNDMAWFSLGGAYAQAGRHGEAAAAYTKCYELNPAMSKAYQLAGKALLDAGQRDAGVATLKAGYSSAAERGDRMPMKAMGELLEALGEKPPEVKGAGAATVATTTGSFVCKRSGKPGTQMSRAPFKGPLGAWILANISKETFEGWIRQGTKVINEMRLDLSRDEDAATYDKQMREFLGIDDALLAELTGA